MSCKLKFQLVFFDLIKLFQILFKVLGFFLYLEKKINEDDFFLSYVNLISMVLV